MDFLLHFGCLGVVLSQAVMNTPTAPDATGAIAQQAEHIGVVGLLAIAVAVLWKALQVQLSKKDETLEHVVAALTMANETNRELRVTVADSVKAKEALSEAIAGLRLGLGELPCQLVAKETRKNGAR